MDAAPPLQGPGSLLPREETPNDTTKIAVATLFGIVAALVIVTLLAMVYFHMRKRKQERFEDSRLHELDDYDDDVIIVDHNGQPSAAATYPKRPADALVADYDRSRSRSPAPKAAHTDPFDEAKSQGPAWIN